MIPDSQYRIFDFKKYIFCILRESYDILTPPYYLIIWLRHVLWFWCQENYTEALGDRLTTMGGIIISEITGGGGSDQVRRKEGPTKKGGEGDRLTTMGIIISDITGGGGSDLVSGRKTSVVRGMAELSIYLQLYPLY